jgi:hypothetical protein
MLYVVLHMYIAQMPFSVVASCKLPTIGYDIPWARCFILILCLSVYRQNNLAKILPQQVWLRTCYTSRVISSFFVESIAALIQSINLTCCQCYSRLNPSLA